MQPTEQRLPINGDLRIGDNQPAPAASIPDNRVLSNLPSFLYALATNLLQKKPLSEEAIETILSWPQTLGCNQAITLKPDTVLLSEQLNLLQEQILTSVTEVSSKTCAAANTTQPPPLTIAASPTIAATYNSQGIPALWVSTVESACFRLQGWLTLALPEITGVELPALLPQDNPVQTTLTTLRTTLSDYGIQGGVLEFYGKAVEQITAEQRLMICEALATDGYQGFFPPQTTPDGSDPASQAESTAIYSNTLSLSALATDEKHPDEPAPADSNTEPRTAYSAHIDLTPLTQATQTDRFLEPGTATLFHENSSLQQLQASISEAETNTCTIAFGGNTFGNGSLEGQEITSIQMRCCGIGAVVAESFNNSFRSLLINNGVLPLEFIDGDSWTALELTSKDKITLDVPKEIYPYEPVVMTIYRDSGRRELVELTLRLDNKFEIERGSRGGALQQALTDKPEAKETNPATASGTNTYASS